MTDSHKFVFPGESVSSLETENPLVNLFIFISSYFTDYAIRLAGP